MFFLYYLIIIFCCSQNSLKILPVDNIARSKLFLVHLEHMEFQIRWGIFHCGVRDSCRTCIGGATISWGSLILNAENGGSWGTESAGEHPFFYKTGAPVELF